MKATRNLIGILIEFTACMKLSHDDFRGWYTFFGVNGSGYAASIVAHRDWSSGIQYDLNAIGMAGKGLIDGIVDNFIDHMVQARPIVRVTNIHARTFADSVKTTKDLDGVGAVFWLVY